MKKLMLMLVVLGLVLVGSAQAGVVFEDDFAGTNIDLAKWAVTQGSGSVAQNELLTISGNNTWDTEYVTSIPAVSSADGGDNLSFTVQHGGNSAALLENMERPARDCKDRHKPILLMRHGGA